MDDLEGFLNWWMETRPIQSEPNEDRTVFDGALYGVVLYRQAPYQVQMFIIPPNCEIDDHVHPNVDSYEVYLSGDIKFRIEGKIVEDNVIRVYPTASHGGSFGPRGGCFVSVQKWLNGVIPTSVGADWKDAKGNTQGIAYSTQEL
jgi:hypothetical protein